MKKQEIDKVIKLRNFLIKEYSTLDGSANPGTAMMKQQDCAYVLSSAIKSIDDILSEYVSFKK